MKAARTIRQHKERILEYIPVRLTNGLPEGLNHKIMPGDYGKTMHLLHFGERVCGYTG